MFCGKQMILEFRCDVKMREGKERVAKTNKRKVQQNAIISLSRPVPTVGCRGASHPPDKCSVGKSPRFLLFVLVEHKKKT